ncbi:MAG: 50S ribosomal protein L24 [candidate division Zixibacteria bacterium HGW-Zixibacteria-1]|nr:ribosomal protein L24 [uncultured bacterium]PKK84596.1 MAG: 50S ribosomal protein L24 [candidate division Zixibacteria bacterium HGW-Zixibacteria-1]
MRIRKGDTVVIRRGKYRSQEAGKYKTGKVLHVFTDSDRLIVESVNMISRHTRPSQKNPKGGIVKKESPIQRANVALFCKSCAAPTKIGFKVLDESDGSKKKIRICRKCGEEIS